MIPPRPSKTSVPSRPAKKIVEIEPNRLFDNQDEAEHWLQTHIPGSTIIKVYEYTRLRIRIKRIPVKDDDKPIICPVALLPEFKTWKEAEKFNDANGHAPILAKWQCRHCGCWHYWTTLHTDTNGGFKSGTFRISKYLRSLIERTRKLDGELKTFERE